MSALLSVSWDSWKARAEKSSEGSFIHMPGGLYCLSVGIIAGVIDQNTYMWPGLPHNMVAGFKQHHEQKSQKEDVIYLMTLTQKSGSHLHSLLKVNC